MRHAYEGMLLTLTEDFETGALTAEGVQEPGCHGDGQFDEKKCRFHVPLASTLCEGRVRLQLFYGAWPVLTEEHGTFDAIV